MIRYLRWLRLLYGRPRALRPREAVRVDPEPIAIDWDKMRERAVR